ncbi:MAG: cytidine deaminase [bacterium]|jgi:cytidine deaminase
MTDKELLEKAIEARARAYAPYSEYHVGAAALAASGKVYTGANVENRSYGLTVCAERNAIFAAVAAGERNIVKVAIVADGKRVPLPCGACLQVMEEFGVNEVVVGRPDGTFETHAFADLLPRPFTWE